MTASPLATLHKNTATQAWWSLNGAWPSCRRAVWLNATHSAKRSGRLRRRLKQPAPRSPQPRPVPPIAHRVRAGRRVLIVRRALTVCRVQSARLTLTVPPVLTVCRVQIVRRAQIARRVQIARRALTVIRAPTRARAQSGRRVATAHGRPTIVRPPSHDRLGYLTPQGHGQKRHRLPSHSRPNRWPKTKPAATAPRCCAPLRVPRSRAPISVRSKASAMRRWKRNWCWRAKSASRIRNCIRKRVRNLSASASTSVAARSRTVPVLKIAARGAARPAAARRAELCAIERATESATERAIQPVSKRSLKGTGLNTHPRPSAAFIVVLAGVSAALHVGKLAPAIASLQQALHISLLQAGFLLSMVQLAGMSLGLALGAWADGLGARRSMLMGLCTLALASALGGLADGPLPLMVLRVAEGFGFMLVVLPAPGLLRSLVAPARLSAMLGIWGSYMPLGTALALLIGPLCLQALGWRGWWWLLGGLALLMAAWLAHAVPATAGTPGPAAGAGVRAWRDSLRQTLAAPGPWLVAAVFALYSGQWLAVIGFLPTIYIQAGMAAAASGVLTALAAAVNICGNVASGRLLQRGVPARRLLVLGFATMGGAAALAFADTAAPGWLRFAAVLLFSGVGGLIPGTLFTLAVRVAPAERALASTVGWVQQWSSLGQFAGPPAVAWVASQAGGWQWTWLATGASSVLGVVVSAALMKRLR